MSKLQAIKYSRGSLQLLDQRLLPAQTVYLDVLTCEDAHKLIKDMAVRGAPAIAVAGILGLAVELHVNGGGQQFNSCDDAARKIKERLVYLVTSRPTAVNLADSSKKLHALIDAESAATGATPMSITTAVINYAEAMIEEDIAANRAIGSFGMQAMLDAASECGKGVNGKLRVLTHCNTGSLATAGYGTALGCIRALHEAGNLEHAFCTETRPYNQGARLTAYELVVEGMPATLIADSAAAALMAAGRVDAVVVGADRVAANGDTANKVGTCMLSHVAAAHGVPFFVAAPSTSIDPEIASGADIEIEERSGTELTHSHSHKDVRVVADGIGTWNPAFDVAPCDKITGIITEKGMVPKEAGAFRIRNFFQQHGLFISNAAPDSVLRTGPGFYALDAESVKAYVAADAALAARVGPPESLASWTAREIGDGNINFVFVVEGPTGGVVVKQGLPYVRCIGESWPLSQERLKYEATSLRAMHRHCPAHVPQVYKFDATMCVIAMQYLAPPHVILRYGILDGAIYPQAAAQLSEYLACCLFRTSLLAMGSAAFRQLADQFSNHDMCALTEQVIFTDPYYAAPSNRHTSPQLDSVVEALHADTAAKVAAAKAKAKFCQNREALLHGDLHTGSCMVTDKTLFVIDSEFAFYGPIAFDVGKIIANLLLTFFALDGHSSEADTRCEQRGWVLQTVKDVWNMFSARFTELWHEEGSPSCLFPQQVFGTAAQGGNAAIVNAQTQFMQDLFSDALLFAGCVMIRRLVGVAHNADFERIENAEVRAVCETRGLVLGRELLVNHAQHHSIETVAELALETRNDGKKPNYPLAQA